MYFSDVQGRILSDNGSKRENASERLLHSRWSPAAARESSQFLLWKIFSHHGSTRAYSKDFEELKREALERVSSTRLTYYIEREKRTKESNTWLNTWGRRRRKLETESGVDKDSSCRGDRDWDREENIEESERERKRQRDRVFRSWGREVGEGYYQWWQRLWEQ